MIGAKYPFAKSANLDLQSRPFEPGTDEWSRLESALDKLKPFRRQVIVRRFGLDGKAPETFAQIARNLSLSRSYVAEVSNRALRELVRQLRWIPPSRLAGKNAMDLRSISIDDLALSVRSYNCLKNASIETLYDLAGASEAELLKIKNFGVQCLAELRRVLAKHGLAFSSERPSTSARPHGSPRSLVEMRLDALTARLFPPLSPSVRAEVEPREDLDSEFRRLVAETHKPDDDERAS
jgi:hypothetical protein